VCVCVCESASEWHSLSWADRVCNCAAAVVSNTSLTTARAQRNPLSIRRTHCIKFFGDAHTTSTRTHSRHHFRTRSTDCRLTQTICAPPSTSGCELEDFPVCKVYRDIHIDRTSKYADQDDSNISNVKTMFVENLSASIKHYYCNH